MGLSPIKENSLGYGMSSFIFPLVSEEMGFWVCCWVSSSFVEWKDRFWTGTGMVNPARVEEGQEKTSQKRAAGEKDSPFSLLGTLVNASCSPRKGWMVVLS